MPVSRLSSGSAFVVFDLEGAQRSAGVARSAPKVLVDGATWLARSRTYAFASFELQVGGASAGVSAPAGERAAAVAAFVAEVGPWAAEGRLALAPGRGVPAAELGPLHAVDPRSAFLAEHGTALTAVGVAACAERALGSLEGRAVAVEALDEVGVAVAAEVVARGARLACVGTPGGARTAPGGTTPAEVAEGLRQHGADLPEAASWGAGEGPALAAPVDVVVVGSKAGVVDHGAAAGVRAGLVVPSGPIPVTAKALAVLGRAGVVVLPDFVTTAGPDVAAFADPAGPPADVGGARAEVARLLPEALAEVLDAPAGPVLAACARAESFLATWHPTLPFGRPLA